MRATWSPFVSPNNLTLITELVTLVGNAQFAELEEVIATDPLVLNKDAFPLIIAYAQEAFALAYRWPYWISIAFGSTCFVLSFFVGDIGSLLTNKVAAEMEPTDEQGRTQ
jgi:hypothetical protein